MILSETSNNVPDDWIQNRRYMLFDNVNSLSNLVKFDWYENQHLIEDVLHCVVNLVSYNGCYATSCFEMLVKCFVPKELFQEDGEKYYDLALAQKISRSVHITLQKILQMVPLSTSSFYKILKESFPHKRHDEVTQQMYLRNLLLVTQYCPSLLESLLMVAVDQLIQVDVDIKLEDLPEEDDDLLFGVDTEKVDEMHLCAQKLDCMMETIFEYLDAMFGVASSSKSDSLPFTTANNIFSHDQTFASLLRIFDELILNTHKSKYTQFLIFYVCRLGERKVFAHKFINHLLTKVAEPAHPITVRMASAAYLGGFLARAKFLPVNLIYDTLLVLVQWASTYQTNAGDQAHPDADLHGLFYMVVQSTYYVFCFHHQALVREKLLDFADPLRRVSESRLNPFKLCFATVVREFCRIIGKLRWFAAEEIMARNDRLVLNTKTSFGKLNQLESFFPFDPYLLRNSAKYIDELYNVWTNNVDVDEDEELDSSEETDESESENESDCDSEYESHTAMSITPEVESHIKRFALLSK